MRWLSLLPCLFLAFTLTACEVDQTEEGSLPDVDVNVEPGNAPEYDVDWAEVDVGTTTEVVEVPRVIVTTEEERVEVPVIDVNMPNGDAEKMERTLTIEAEVSEEATLQIQEVYATGNRLIVVSELNRTGQDLGGETIRVSDRLVLNAPDMDVKHVIIGEQPDGAYNTQHMYVGSRAELSDMMQGGRTIYQRS